MTAADFGLGLGSRVVASDNKQLGVVSDVRGPYFKVHRRLLASDRWFDVNDVVAVLEDEVIVEFDRRSAAEHQVPEVVVNEPRLDARVDHLLDDSTVEEQRERMERELGAQ
jgi:rRNA processing protein Gar1